jgi:hypothetical protein
MTRLPERDRVTRFLASDFFNESSSPKPLKIALGTYIDFFSKIRGDIRKSGCTTGINDTDGKFATCINDTRGKKLVIVSARGVELRKNSKRP